MKKYPQLPGTLPAKQSKPSIIPAFIFFAAMLLVIILPGKLFAQAPVISSFNPATGSVGTLVTINGTNLSTPTVLTIGGQKAIMVSNTGSVLVAMVMPGAVTGNVSITTGGGAVTGSGNFTVTATKFPSMQQGAALVPAGGSSAGQSVSVSADGNTAIIGGLGAAWVYTRSGGTWTQQGSALAVTGNVGNPGLGISVGLSADGNTAIVGGNQDNGGLGAAWVYTRSGGIWTQQGTKLVGTGSVGAASQGASVSLSADGNTAIVGGPGDNGGVGAVWAYTRSGGTWTQQGTKLVGTGGTFIPAQGFSVSLSADGNTAIVGGPKDNIGVVWFYTRSGGIWTQQGAKLIGTGGSATPAQGTSVSLSADGNTAIVGGPGDNGGVGAAWIYIRSGSAWAQQGSKLLGSGQIGDAAEGTYVSLSADGNTAIVGGPNDNDDAGGVGATWVYTRSGGAWTQQGPKLVGTGAIAAANQGTSVALSADGSTAMAGGVLDNSGQGAAWVFTTSSNALLSTIALTPDSAEADIITVGSATTYTASFGSANDLLTITPTAQNLGAVIKVNGVIVTNGTASASIALPVGKTTINVTVTSQDGTATKTYLVIITRAKPNPMDNLGLTNSTPAAGAYSLRLLSNSYKGPLARILIGTKYYDVYPDASNGKKFSLKSPVSEAYTTYNATATGATGNSLHNVIKGQSATVATWYDQSGNSNDAVQGTTSIQPEIINNGSIDITNALPTIKFLGVNYLVVTSTEFNTDLSGSVVFNATNANNTSGTPDLWYSMNGIFGSEQPFAVNDFGYGILNNVFTAGNGPNDNSVGGATVVDDGTTRVNSWTRENSSGNVALYANKAADGSGTLNNGTRTAVPSVAIGAITTTGGGDFNGTISELTVFPAVYTLPERKTIEGNQATYYGIKSANAALTSITLTPDSPLADSVVTGSTTTFSASVSYATTSVKITPTTQDPTATIKVNGVAVTSGTLSKNIALAVGTDTLTTVVTAQDGITTQTYLVIVTRQPKQNPLDNLGLTNSTPAAGAYSLRLLSSSYKGPLARILIGTKYYDVYPDASNGKKFSLKSPVSEAYTTYNATATGATGNSLHNVIKGQSATVATWYDQSGNSNDAVQGTTSIQPEIINNGSIDITNALPTIKFLGVNYLVVTSTEFNTDLSGSVVFNATNANNTSGTPDLWYSMNGIFGSEQPFAVNDFGYGILNNVFTAGNGPNDNSVGGATVVDDGTTRVNSWTRENSSGNVALYANKAADGSGTLNNGTRTAVPSVAIGAITTTGGGDFNGTISELTVFPTVYTLAQRQTIEGNQATYYGILSANAALTSITLTPHSALTDTVTVGNLTTYNASVSNFITSVKVTPTAQDPAAKVTVNGVTVKSGTASHSIALAVGQTVITTVVTAQDGISTQTYAITVTRATGPLRSLYMPISVVEPTDSLNIENDGILVHQGVSPNGDGFNDYLHIDGLAAYPDNKVTIVDRSGAIIFEAAGYDNITKVFDGHSSINGRIQQPGTYFYSLDYVADGQSKHKTGYIILKY